MSLIGTLEQFTLSNVLQRLETHEKTGLLMLKQDGQWVEFYMRNGQLLCVGPVRTNSSLGERLLQDGLISTQALRESQLAVGDAAHSETRFAITLMELGYISRDELRNWAIQKTVAVLQTLLLWESGDIYFEENTNPPADRLLAGMSVTSLIETATARFAPQSMQANYAMQTPPIEASPIQPTPPMMPSTPKPDIARVITLTSASQFLDESAFAANPAPTADFQANNYLSAPETPASQLFSPASFQANNPLPTPDFQANNYLPAADSFAPMFGDAQDEDLSFGPGPVKSGSLTAPEPVMQPVQPRSIDTSFMRPDMILIPMDLSAFREQNPQVQVTPDQWRLLTYVDGRTTLQKACQELAMLPDMLCQLAGELMAEGLIHVSAPERLPLQELSPLSQEYVASGMSNGYITPGYAAAAASPWSTSMPALPSSDVAQHNAGLPFETHSQWGNGGNGATFIPGRGWITTPQPLQPLPPSGPLNSGSGIYAPAGGGYYG